MAYTKLPEADKATWVAALRSGDYKQGCAAYRRTFDYAAYSGVGIVNRPPEDYTYCATGVAVDVLVFRGAWPIDTMAPPPAAYGLDPLAWDHIIAMNDSGTSFDEIADWIEEKL